VVAPDAPGFGESPAIAPDGYRPSALADLVPPMLDALGIASCTFLGFSWGATVGCHLAARHPGRVTSLVLLDAGFADPDPLDRPITVARLAEQVRADLADLAAGLATIDEAIAWARARTGRFTPAVDEQWRAAFDARDGRPVPAVAAEVLAAATVGLGAEPPSRTWPALQRGPVPVLLLTAASADAAAVARFCAEVPRAVVRPVPSPGHDVLVETPGEVCAAIDEWARLA
jgi:pimeloyl-ACP methyl ester carboxylesterase